LPAERPPPPPPFANKLDPLPPLADQVVRKEGPNGLVTQARLLLKQITPGDGVRLMLGWDTIGQRKLDGEHPLGRQQVDWDATFASFKVLIRPADGPWRVLEAGPGAGKSPRLPLHFRSAVVLRLADTGLHPPDAEPHRWTEPAARLLAGPGKHRLKLMGRLALEQGAVPFEMAEVELQVAEQSKALLPVAEIEAIAGKHVAQQLQLKEAPRPRKATVEDVAGHRVVRFSVASGGRYDVDFVEVVVAPGGEVLAHSRKKVFTCIARGTLLETTRGRRPIEQIRAGDKVWGYDTARGRRVLTTVRHAYAGQATRLVRLTPELRTTPAHPVFTGGSWVEAGEISAGAPLLRFDLQAASAGPQPLAERVTVIDLSVDWPHNFFAGGILVHNKAAETPEGFAVSTDSWSTLYLRPTPPEPPADEEQQPPPNGAAAASD